MKKHKEKEKMQLQTLLRQKSRELEKLNFEEQVNPISNKQTSYKFSREKAKQNISDLTTLAQSMNLKEMKCFLMYEKSTKNYVTEERKQSIVDSLKILEDIETILKQKKIQQANIAIEKHVKLRCSIVKQSFYKFITVI